MRESPTTDALKERSEAIHSAGESDSSELVARARARYRLDRSTTVAMVTYSDASDHY